MMQILQPPGWAKPRGFSNGIAVKGGTAVYIAGQVGWAGSGAWQARDFAGQFRQALRNVLEVLAQPRGIVVGDGGAWPITRAQHGSAFLFRAELPRCAAAGPRSPGARAHRS